MHSTTNTRTRTTDRPRNAPTSLDTRKTSCEKPTQDALERGFRFAECREHFDALDAALPLLDIDPKQKDRFTTCGTNAWVVFSDSRRQYTLRLETCKLRWCPRCHSRVTKRIADRLRSALAPLTKIRWKFLTLTTRSTTATLEESIKHLRTSFRRLRQRSIWRKNVRGGYAVLEITWNTKTHQWHPHLHCIIDSAFLPQATLSKAWLAATRNSMIVDIRAIRSTEAAIGYVAKYLGKLPALELLADPVATSEFINAMHSTRLLSQFGTLPKITVEPEPPEGINDWRPVTRLSQLLYSVERGEEWAIRILAALKGNPDEIDNDLPHDST